MGFTQYQFNRRRPKEKPCEVCGLPASLQRNGDWRCFDCAEVDQEDESDGGRSFGRPLRLDELIHPV